MHRALHVTARAGAAIAAGYFLAHACAAFLTLALPFARPDRVVAATLFSFVAWCVAALHAFATGSTWRAWWLPCLLGAAMLGVALAFPDAGMRA